jgi:cell division protein FtsN
MATNIRQGKLSAPRTRRQYRLEVDGRTMMLMVGLLVLTGVVVFYLGMLSGMGMRGAEAFPPVAGITPNATPPNAPQGAEEQALTFNQELQAGQEQSQGLTVSDSQISRRTRDLLNRAERELVLEETTPPAAPKAPAQPQASQPAAPRASEPTAPSVNRAPAPSNPPATSSSDTQYTVQVFSSTSQEKAQALMTKLRRQGFNAYLNQFQSAQNRTWYRVRVGRSGKADAEALEQRLRKETDLRDTAVLHL